MQKGGKLSCNPFALTLLSRRRADSNRGDDVDESDDDFYADQR